MTPKNHTTPTFGISLELPTGKKQSFWFVYLGNAWNNIVSKFQKKNPWPLESTGV